jgi:hypothetical protein
VATSSSSDSSGKCPHCGRSWHITINTPPGSSGRDIVDALKKYERHNGPRWTVGEVGPELFIADAGTEIVPDEHEDPDN